MFQTLLDVLEDYTAFSEALVAPQNILKLALTPVFWLKKKIK